MLRPCRYERLSIENRFFLHERGEFGPKFTASYRSTKHAPWTFLFHRPSYIISFYNTLFLFWIRHLSASKLGQVIHKASMTSSAYEPLLNASRRVFIHSSTEQYSLLIEIIIQSPCEHLEGLSGFMCGNTPWYHHLISIFGRLGVPLGKVGGHSWHKIRLGEGHSAVWVRSHLKHDQQLVYLEISIGITDSLLIFWPLIP